MNKNMDSQRSDNDEKDLNFEKDPDALHSILNHCGLTRQLEPIVSTLTPATKLTRSQKKNLDKYDYFEGKNGQIFFRPKSPKFEQKSPRNKKSNRVMGSGLVTSKQPIRLHLKSPIKFNGHSLKTQGHVVRPHTEKKLVPFVSPPQRQSISERKEIPAFSKLQSNIPKPTGAKKLQFGSGSEVSQEEDFEFARPLATTPDEKGMKKEKSKLELILMREGMIGLPRESLSGLLRQSLTRDELEKMFEDDSTESFENLEKKLRTPKRPFLKGNNVKDEVKSFEENKENYHKHGKIIVKASDAFSDVQLNPQIPETNAQNVSIMKTQSTNDLSQEKEEFQNLARSCSTFELRDDNQKSKIESSLFLQRAREAYGEYVRERNELESKMKELMIASKKRKENFKMLWGVSPAKINKIKSNHNFMVFSNPVVAFSPQASKEIKESPLERDCKALSDEIFSPPPLFRSKAGMEIENGNKNNDPCDDKAFKSADKSEYDENYYLDFSIIDESIIGSSAMDVSLETEEEGSMKQPSKLKHPYKTVRFFSPVAEARSFIETDYVHDNINKDSGIDDTRISLGVNVNLGHEGSICITEVPLCSSKFHAPTPRHPKGVCEKNTFKIGRGKVNTPVALRYLSSMVQKEKEALYEEEGLINDKDETGEESFSITRKEIDFDEDDTE